MSIISVVPLIHKYGGQKPHLTCQRHHFHGTKQYNNRWEEEQEIVGHVCIMCQSVCSTHKEVEGATVYSGHSLVPTDERYGNGIVGQHSLQVAQYAHDAVTK